MTGDVSIRVKRIAEAACLGNCRSLPSAPFHERIIAMRILVADKLAEEGLAILKKAGIDYDVKTGLKVEELASTVGEYDALIVRSAAKVPAPVLANPGKLRVIARA